MFLAKVYISLKPKVSDPQGLTIKQGLHTLGFAQVRNVRAGKYLEIQLDEKNQSNAATGVKQMSHQLLVNPVIEEFKFELEEIPP
jgi:phosphoribosylformylglycinamidine synthase